MRSGASDVAFLLPVFLWLHNSSKALGTDLDIPSGCEPHTVEAEDAEPRSTCASVLLQKKTVHKVVEGLPAPEALKAPEPLDVLQRRISNLSSTSSSSSASVSLMALETEKKPPKKKTNLAEVEDIKASDGSSRSQGDVAPLNEKGYKSVAKLKSLRQMEAFIKRVIEQRGLSVVDEGSLKGVVPYYSGHKAMQSFQALKQEISKAEAKEDGAWLALPQDQAGDKEDVSDSLKHKPKKSLVQTKQDSRVRPHVAKRKTVGSLVQTEDARSAVSSHSDASWVSRVLSTVSGQAVYWIGARVTLVACAGSILFGLFLYEGSSRKARGAPLEQQAAFWATTTPVLDRRSHARQVAHVAGLEGS